MLGLDLAIEKTGVCLPDGTTFTSRGQSKDMRLVRLRDEIEESVLEHDITHAIIEDLPKNAQGAGITGRAQGVAREVLTRLDVPIVTVVAATLKKFATNNGRATKDEMWWALPTDIQSVIEMKATDEVDAYHLWAMGIDALAGRPVPPVVDWSPWGLGN